VNALRSSGRTTNACPALTRRPSLAQKLRHRRHARYRPFKYGLRAPLFSLHRQPQAPREHIRVANLPVIKHGNRRDLPPSGRAVTLSCTLAGRHRVRIQTRALMVLQRRGARRLCRTACPNRPGSPEPSRRSGTASPRRQIRHAKTDERLVCTPVGSALDDGVVLGRQRLRRSSSFPGDDFECPVLHLQSS